jgi:hypothetical protein
MKLDLPVTVYQYALRFEAFTVIPYPVVTQVLTASGSTREEALALLTEKAEAALSAIGVKEASRDSIVLKEPLGELATLMEAARERAASIAADKERPQVVDYMHPPIGGEKPWSATASESYQQQERLISCLLALEPLAAIADAYDGNGLDECRPDWVAAGNETYDPQKELYCGRGGKALLTLQQALTAREVLRGTIAGRLLPKTFRNQKHALKEIRTWANSGESAATIVDHIRRALKELPE